MKKIILLMIISMVLSGCSTIQGTIEKLVDPKVVNEEPELDDTTDIAPEYLTTDGVLDYDESEILDSEATVELDGEVLAYDPDYNNGDDSKVDVIMFRERSLVPLRELANNLGYELEWDGAGKKQRLYIKSDTTIIETQLNSNVFFIKKGEAISQVYSETPVIKYESKIYVPTRLIGETFGVTVEWIGEENKIIISTKGDKTNE